MSRPHSTLGVFFLMILFSGACFGNTIIIPVAGSAHISLDEGGINLQGPGFSLFADTQSGDRGMICHADIPCTLSAQDSLSGFQAEWTIGNRSSSDNPPFLNLPDGVFSFLSAPFTIRDDGTHPSEVPITWNAFFTFPYLPLSNLEYVVRVSGMGIASIDESGQEVPPGGNIRIIQTTATDLTGEALITPESSSIALFGFGVMALSGAFAWRRFGSRSIDEQSQ